MKASVLLFSILIAFLHTSCNDEPDQTDLEAGHPVRLDSLQGTSPYLTNDHHGRPVISWARILNDSVAEFCYAISEDNGKTFGKPIPIPGSTNLKPHSENLPKIIFKPGGQIIAVWGAANPNPINKYSGLIFYSQSEDNGASWSGPSSLVKDTSSFDQRYSDLALLPSGEAGIIWLDNRKSSGREGSSLYFARTEGMSGFQEERKVNEGCCQCCRTDLFVDSKGGIHILYRGIIQDSIRDMLHSVSSDNGQSFSASRLISDDRWVLKGCPHTGPSMTETNGQLHFAWYTGGKKKGCFYTSSTDGGSSFGHQSQVSTMGSHPQIIRHTKGRVLIAWDENYQSDGEFLNRIHVQLRNTKGREIRSGMITTDGLSASYPAMASLTDNTALVAFTQKEGKNSYISFQEIRLGK